MNDDLLRYRSMEFPKNHTERLFRSEVLCETELFRRLKMHVHILKNYGSVDDFNFFVSNFFKPNFQEILGTLDAIDLLDIIDAYADFGNEKEKGIALAISTYINNEKCQMTFPQVMRLQSKMPLSDFEKESRRYTKRQLPSLRLKYDPAVYEFYDRLFRVISSHEILFAIWLKVFTEMVTEPTSGISFICACSDSGTRYIEHFKELMMGKYVPLEDSIDEEEPEFNVLNF